MNKAVVLSLFLLGIISFNSCARQGTPSGGPRDETPPKLIGSNPDTLAVNVDPNIKEIEINFDEYIQIKEYSKNSVISPPFDRNPIVTPISMAEKKVKIKLQEPLQPNTTYSFNFGDAIQDYNENNKLSNFNYVFSTGSYIDSLSIKGKIYTGYDFDLPKKVLVGLYKYDQNFNDSIIIKQKPYYIARVNENGEFNLKYLRDGQYKIIAFEDALENTKFDFGKEKIAFNNEVIELKENQNVDLKLFRQKPSYRIVKSEQKGFGQLLFKTEGAGQPIKITPIGRDFKTAKIDIHLEKDSVNFWFNPEVEKFENKSERLRFAIQHKEKIDTVSLLYTTPIKEYELTFKPLNDSKLAPNQNFKILASAPIKSIDKSLINVFRDTIEIPFDVNIDSINKQIIHFNFKKDLAEKFEVNALPKAFIDHFEAPNDTLVYQPNTGTREDFGSLKVRVNNLQEGFVILQLIKKNQSYDIYEERKGVGREFDFINLLPGEYYLRLLVDKNNNGIWDTGDILSTRQPEPVYIYPTKINVRPMWDADETWIINEESEKFVLPIEKIPEEEKKSNK